MKINSILRRTTLVLSLSGLFCSAGNAEGTASSQGKSETTIGLSYIKKADLSKTVIAVVKAKKDKKFTPAKGVRVNFYVLHDKDQSFLKSMNTDDKGEVRILLDKDLPLDENHAFTIIAKIENENRYEDAEERIHLKEATLMLVLNPKDTSRLVTAKVTEKGKEIPVKGVELKFYVQRNFGNMPASDEYTVSTDEKGEASFNYPKNIPGDTAGLINVIVRMEDNEQFGTIENKAQASWGSALATIKDPFPRALWEPYAPLPLVITISTLFGGVWSVYFFLFFQLRKIKTEGGLIAEIKPKNQPL